ncbi:hypothetical protein KC357_g138 [Hortaea werneckii]|nr:hypothetical protein KC357_g138 [Hortaea werneckii]
MLKYSTSTEAQVMLPVTIMASFVDAASMKEIARGPASLQKSQVSLQQRANTGAAMLARKRKAPNSNTREFHVDRKWEV